MSELGDFRQIGTLPVLAAAFSSVPISIGLPVRSEMMSWQIFSWGTPMLAALSTISRW
jgi:hypothetical protein